MKTERIICPNCKRSIPNLNSYHYCKEVAIDELFIKKSDEIVLAFDKLLEHLADFEDVEISATKTVSFLLGTKHL